MVDEKLVPKLRFDYDDEWKIKKLMDVSIINPNHLSFWKSWLIQQHEKFCILHMEMKIIMNKIKTILICLIIITTCIFCIGLVAINGQKTTVELSKICSIEVDGDYNLTNIGNGISQL